jgi:hypothetical protein
MDSETRPAAPAAFSEKGFYLSEFRGRTLALAARADDLRAPASLEPVLKELEANPTRVVLISTEAGAIESVLATTVLPGGGGPGLEGAVWRGLSRASRVGLVVDDASRFAPTCREIALRLGVSKWIWIDAEGGLRAPDGSRQSFVGLEELRGLLRQGPSGESPWPRSTCARWTGSPTSCSPTRDPGRCSPASGTCGSGAWSSTTTTRRTT